MTLVITNDVRPGGSVTMAIVALPVALTWWFVSFRQGRFSLSNMLAGSALHALTVTAASAWRAAPASLSPLAPIGWAFEALLRALEMELMIRIAAYLLTTFLMIGITLALPRVWQKLRRRCA